MVKVTATATCTALRGTVVTGSPDKPGTIVPVTARVLAERVGWLAGLVQKMAAESLSRVWTDTCLAEVVAGVDTVGRRLPSHGYKAVRRLGWAASAAAGVYTCDRVRCVADEEVARAMRLAVHRRAVLAALVGTWPADPARRTAEEWKSLRAVLPAGVDNATIRNRTRQIVAFIGEHARLPGSVCELEAPPRVAVQVLLAAADKQLVRVHRDDASSVRVWVQLPTVPVPVSRRDWAWHALQVTLPPTVAAGVKLSPPTLRVRADRVRVDLPFTQPVAVAPLTGHTRAVAADWGLNTLLTATYGTLDPDGTVVSSGRALRYDAAGVSRKLDRLRHEREHLKTRIVHQQKLAARRNTPDQALTDKLAILETEHDRVCRKIRTIGNDLAWSAARWLIDQALATGASVVYLEDLTDLQAGGLSRSWNRRLSGATRGTLVDALRHLGQKDRVAVVTVPARGTSSGCPRCEAKVKHVKAPDRPAVRGYRWALCGCGHSTDRDFSAAQRILARGLAGQAQTRRNRAGHPSIRDTVDRPVRRRTTPTIRPALRAPYSRNKTGPTPRRLPRRGRSFTPDAPATQGSRPTPPPVAGVSNRPAGRAPQNPTPVDVQVPATIPSNPPRTHKVRGAVLGRGFHHHVTSTPIQGRAQRSRGHGTPGSPKIAQGI